MERLRLDLLARVDGEVRFDEGTRGAYSTDGSNYRQPPLGVVVPRTPDAAADAVAVCRGHRVPILSRAGGTSLAGQCTNTAVMIDWAKYCNKLESVDARARTCVVQPGMVLDVLNDQLSQHQLMFGPRPATHFSCGVGGMLGNNSCGSTAQAYGKAVDNIRRMEVVTYDGERMWVGATSDEEYADIVRAGGRRGEIYRRLRELRDRYLSQIRTGYPDIPRRVSGYNLDSLLPENGFDVARALVGSESTLVTILRAELELVPVPQQRQLLVLGYHDIFRAADAVPQVLAAEPHKLEGLDDVLIGLERAEHLHPDALKQLPPGSGWLMVEFAGDDADELRARGEKLVADLESGEQGPAYSYFDDPEHEESLWQVREGGLGATARPPGGHETWEGWEDAAVPPERLGDYLRDFHALLEEYGYADVSALYGHFGQGCIHTRIPFHLRNADGVAAFRSFVERSADLVVSYGGSLSGEHGDGQSRGELLVRMFGDELIAAFGELKAIFDPDDKMNPGKIVHPNPLDSHLRLGTGFALKHQPSLFAYPEDDNSFANATMRCVGVGRCRNHGDSGDVMCPSYRATKEEEHSTRGRARLLSEMMRVGGVVSDGWRSEDVKNALDLCLACKGCKSDCPVNVDMATYKAEFLAHHYQGRIRPMAHYSMGWLPVWARAASVAPGPANALAHTPGLAGALKRVGGVAAERDLPTFAHQRFQDWFARRPSPARPGPRGDVLLWPDTFTNNFHPHIGRAAVEVLEAAGFTVRVPQQTLCCGLTWISTGQIKTAKRVLRRTLDAIREPVRAGVPVVGLEPSCSAVFRADMADLLPNNEDAQRLGEQFHTLAELIQKKAGDWSVPRLPEGATALVQTHCHQHAVIGSGPDDALLDRMGVRLEGHVPGCCGLAGNFGFEQGHYEVSRTIGEEALLPAVRKADPSTHILADGFSCRTQVEQGDAGREARHLAELLADAVRSGGAARG